MEVEDEDTRKEEGIGNGSKESRTMGESHEVPCNAAIHRSAEEIEQNRQEAIMKRQQRISQKEKEIKEKDDNEREDKVQVEKEKEDKEREDEAQEEEEIPNKTEEGKSTDVGDSAVDENDITEMEETLLEKIAKEMEDIAKGQDSEVGNEGDRQKIDLEQEIKESKRKNEQLQSIVRAQETLLKSKKDEIEEVKQNLTKKSCIIEEETRNLKEELGRKNNEIEEKDRHKLKKSTEKGKMRWVNGKR